MISQTTPAPDVLRRPMMACIGLAVAAIVLVAVGRQDRAPAPIDPEVVKASVQLSFTDVGNGDVIASDAQTGAEIARLAPGEGGFVRVTMRGFAAERKRRGMSNAEPFLLARLADGDLILDDGETGRRMLLNAFGPSNEGAFAMLLDRKEAIQ